MRRRPEKSSWWETICRLISRYFLVWLGIKCIIVLTVVYFTYFNSRSSSLHDDLLSLLQLRSAGFEISSVRTSWNQATAVQQYIRTLQDTPHILIGGISSSGMETLRSLLEALHIKPVLLRQKWQLAGDASQLTSYLASLTTPSIILDDSGLEFQLEFTSVYPNAQLYLLLREPDSFLRHFSQERLAHCQENMRMYNDRLRTSTVTIHASWMMYFGVTCPSDVQAMKQYHTRNIITQLLSPSVTTINIDTGLHMSELCTSLEVFGVDQDDCIRSMLSQVASTAIDSYAHSLAHITNIMDAHSFFMEQFLASLTHIQHITTPTRGAFATYLLEQHASPSASVMILGASLAHRMPTNTPKKGKQNSVIHLSETFHRWGIHASPWHLVSHLFRIAEHHRNPNATHGREHFGRVIHNVEALMDFPTPLFLPELLLVRPNHLVIAPSLTDGDAWIQDYKSWMHDYNAKYSCSAKAAGQADDTWLTAQVCHPIVFTFGHSAPSDLQALKRALLHRLTVSILVDRPKILSVNETIVSRQYARAVCNSIRGHLKQLSSKSPIPLANNTLIRGKWAAYAQGIGARSGPELAAHLQCDELKFAFYDSVPKILKNRHSPVSHDFLPHRDSIINTKQLTPAL